MLKCSLGVYKLKNKDNITPTLRGQKVRIFSIHEMEGVFTIEILSGEEYGKILNGCRIENFERDFEVYIMNKGKWVF